MAKLGFLSVSGPADDYPVKMGLPTRRDLAGYLWNYNVFILDRSFILADRQGF